MRAGFHGSYAWQGQGRPTRSQLPCQRGAALMVAMLIVSLVASLAASALWQQYRAVEIEAADRTRVQANWVLTGALDWARLILREDARTSGSDDLTEPWSVPLAESRLSSFLAADHNNNADTEPADASDMFLSSQIIDAQSRMNVTNLLDGDALSPAGLQVFKRLFELLGLQEAELTALANNLLAVTKGGTASGAPLLPQRVDQLVWLGLSPNSLAKLRPHIVLLPIRTPVNLNTASAEVIFAAIPSLSMSEARQIVAQRNSTPFRTLADVGKFMPEIANLLTESQQSVSSRLFEVYCRLRMENSIIQEVSLVRRDYLNVTTVYRERTALVENAN